MKKYHDFNDCKLKTFAGVVLHTGVIHRTILSTPTYDISRLDMKGLLKSQTARSSSLSAIF